MFSIGSGAATAERDVEAVTECPFRLGDADVELADQAFAGGEVGDALVDRVELEQRVTGEVHLGDQALGEAGAEVAVVDVVGAPGVVVVLPGVGARFDGDEFVVAVGVGEDAAFADEVGIDGGVMLVAGVLVAAGGVGLPHLDDGVGDRAAVFVGDGAVDDDAFTECQFAIDDGDVGDFAEFAGVELRARGFGDGVWHADQRLRRMARMGAAVGGRIVERLGVGHVGAKGDRPIG